MLKKLNFAFVFILVFAAVIILQNLPNLFGKPGVNIDLSRASVVKEMKALNRLETASFTIEKIVEAGQAGNVFQNLLYGDRILLVAHGKVVAGVDLEGINEDQVNVNGKRLTINLPPPAIFSSTLDNSKTTVYDRTQGLLSGGNKDLESEARRAAESSITQAACEGGILDEARINAIERITQLFEFAGFSDVEVIIPQGNC